MHSTNPAPLLTLSEQLEELAKRIVRNVPDRRDPFAFHQEKDEIAHQLRRLARLAGNRLV